MFDKTDLKGPLPNIVSSPNTLLNIIETHNDFKIFNYILKLADMQDIFNSIQADFTVFVPSDMHLSHINENVFINMDMGTARSIVKTSMLENRIPSEILNDCPSSYYKTVDPINRLFVTNLSGQTYINNYVRIIKKDVLATNGIIHITNGIVHPIFN